MDKLPRKRQEGELEPIPQKGMKQQEILQENKQIKA